MNWVIPNRERTIGAGMHLSVVNNCSPGDVVVLTAGVRDLHRAWPGRYVVAVETACPDLWLNNPYLVPAEESGSAGGGRQSAIGN